MVRVYPITPQSQFKNNSRATVPLNNFFPSNTVHSTSRIWIGNRWRITDLAQTNFIFGSDISIPFKVRISRTCPAVPDPTSELSTRQHSRDNMATTHQSGSSRRAPVSRRPCSRRRTRYRRGPQWGSPPPTKSLVTWRHVILWPILHEVAWTLNMNFDKIAHWTMLQLRNIL